MSGEFYKLSFYDFAYSLLLLVVMILFFVLPVSVQANEDEETLKQEETYVTDQLVEQQVESLDLTEITEYWNDIIHQYGGFLPESQKGSLTQFLTGEKEFTAKEWMNGFFRFFMHEIIANGKLLGMLIILTIFSVMLQLLQNAFQQSTVSKVAYSIVYMVLIIIALNSFQVANSYTLEAIGGMTNFLIALIPLLLALMASSGAVISASFFHPILIFLMNTSGILIEKVVLPLIFLSALLYIVSTLTDQYKITQLAQLLRNIGIGLMATFLTVFLGVISVQGASSAVADGLTLRTAKFIAGNFIPVLGRMFTDATDTVLSASMLLKNTIGIAGALILLFIAAFPAIKVLTLAFIYKFAAAILQPLGGGPVITCLDVISKSIIYIFAALAIVSLMFFLSITVIIAAGNMSLMVR
ncbi:stage III sporulation protein AE [Bacillus carboniphilus]|uniref:Stage III sporulation protein AE n=1 Tax=Bacillus carboniphilus TaxID=86663 RepID=A0ABY9JZM2_9BACI|nr:stage III sporulation protein AE [Bacillus carboniphilus]WLR43890.1 stage III sporulation protein AE [Bacillus carboniphilus]